MYTSIASYYDTIFPYQETTHQFLDKHLPTGVLLDIACGTGTYANVLQSDTRNIIASDLDAAMIDIAKEKNTKGVTYHVRDMRNISQEQPVDGIYIIGNSLTHASTMDEIQDILMQCYSVLKPGGTLLIQIVNYERVLNKGITTLPFIKKDKISFYREYYFDQHNTMIFQTILEDKKERITNHIPLLPLTKKRLQKKLKKAKFRNVKWYGSFEETPYDKNRSFHTIVVCEK